MDTRNAKAVFRRCNKMGQRSVTLLVILSLLACSDAPPEAKLAETGEALGEAAGELTDLNTRIEKTEALLEELRANRRAQRDKVRTLEQRLAARATDVALFRAIQNALLNDEKLQNVAIAVDVEDGAIVLSGVVETPEQSQHAASVAKQTAGAKSVSSRIRVSSAQENKKGGS